VAVIRLGRNASFATAEATLSDVVEVAVAVMAVAATTDKDVVDVARRLHHHYACRETTSHSILIGNHLW
jgi:endonuclease III